MTTEVYKLFTNIFGLFTTCLQQVYNLSDGYIQTNDKEQATWWVLSGLYKGDTQT